MKKTAVVLFILALCLGILASCNSDSDVDTKQSAYDLYQLANSKFDSVEMSVDLTMTMEADGIELVILSNGIVKEVIRSETDFDMESNMKISISSDLLGELLAELTEMQMQMYYKDGYLYQELLGQKMKTAISSDLARNQSNIPTLDESAIKDSKIEKNGDLTILTFTLDGKAMTNLAKQGLEQSGETMGDLSISDASVTAVIDQDGFLKEMKFAFSMSASQDGETAAIEFDYSIKVLSYNTTTINFPSDLDSYQEFDL
jgi:hypothetical protein